MLVDPDGTATVRTSLTSRGAYLVRLTRPIRLEPGEPLRMSVEVKHIARDGERFDLGVKRAGGVWRSVSIDGGRTPPYASAYR